MRYLNRSRPLATSTTGRLVHHSDNEQGGGPTADPLFSPPLSLLPAGGGAQYRRGFSESLSREYYQPHRAGFAPYFPMSPSPAASSVHHHHQMVAASSPRYSSPPLIGQASSSRDSILGSPRAYEELGPHANRLYPPLDPPAHHATSSISPTAGLYHHSPSPSLEMFSGQHAGTRLLPAHPTSPFHHAAYSGFTSHHHAGSESILLPSHHQLGYYKVPDEVGSLLLGLKLTLHTLSIFCTWGNCDATQFCFEAEVLRCVLATKFVLSIEIELVFFNA